MKNPFSIYPPGVNASLVFMGLNAISFSVITMAPMQLYFKRLDATATALGLLAAIPMLLTILQIPAAHYLEKIGYKKFFFLGWASRTIFILFMALVVILPESVSPTTRITLVLFFLFIWSTIRGFSSCGYMPWITALIPENIRGRYIAMNGIITQLAVMTVMLTSGLLLYYFPDETTFFWMFLSSFICGVLSLFYILKIPDVPIEKDPDNPEPIPWMSILKHRPFMNLMIHNAILMCVYGSGGVIFVILAKDFYQVSDDHFLYIMASAGLLFIFFSLFMGKIADWSGSRPLLFVAAIIHFTHFLGWGMVAAKILPFSFTVIAFQQITWGLGYSLFTIANSRLAMEVVPPVGRAHFFAVLNVIHALVAGLAPILWGIMVDIIANYQYNWGMWEWNSVSILYLVATAIMVLVYVSIYWVIEPKALKTDEFLHELLVKSPRRALDRIYLHMRHRFQ